MNEPSSGRHGTGVAAHYDRLLAEHYSWMFGDFAAKVAGERTLLAGLGLGAGGGERALDLGCGSGFQSLALAELGFAVTAVDTCRRLLDELDSRKGGLPVATREAPIESVGRILAPGFAVAVCMGDTLPHLSSTAAVAALFSDLAVLLRPQGRVVLGFRDQSRELFGTDRFIPVRADDDRIMTCFLEYEPEAVVVHDLVYSRRKGAWSLEKSSYRKLRLSAAGVSGMLEAAGFAVLRTETVGGMSLIVAEGI